MKRGVGGCIGAIVLGVGCGPDPVAQEELEEVCGQEGPFRILPLEPDRQVNFGWQTRIGDRLVFSTERIAPGDEDDYFPDTSDPEVWSTGLCGESPVMLARDIGMIFTVDRWPELLFGCDEETAEVLLLDPLGEREPHVVFAGDPEAFGCALRWTDHGMLSVVPHDEDFGALMLSPYPDDPLTQTSEPVVLLDDVRITSTGRGGTGIVASSIRTFDDFVLALDDEGTLMRIDLADRSVAPLVPDVREVETSRDGRWLLWQDATVTNGDPEAPEGDIFLRDLTTDVDALLARSWLRLSLFPLSQAGAGIVQLGFGFSETQRIFFLPNLDFVDVPGDVSPVAKIDDERWITGSLSDSTLTLTDLKAGTSRPFEKQGRIKWIEDDGLVLFEAKGCCIEGRKRDEGPLWRVPFEGAPEQLASRANEFLGRLSDERMLGPVGIGADWLGDLVVIDLATGQERLVDRHVFALSLDMRWGHEEGLISYSIRDGERSGVYVARLSAEARSGSRKAVREHVGVDVVRGRDGKPVPVPRLRPGEPDWDALAALRSHGGE
ncbi:hypothetical protein [Nannocystis bainbridge]|uniref:Lipoprotein n=1 Tax=Nannocystis bainbridge TaxID=2995303 RepID=A0ABT5DYC8_9BACT|nr:hypothetical protein [Nannocystis bainbridge]MDC0718646.1 hypothetical protein [Nannocystis bainbridge]